MGDDKLPADPFTELQGGAAGLHELYLSFHEAGFSIEQSFALLQTVMAATITSQHLRGSQ